MRLLPGVYGLIEGGVRVEDAIILRPSPSAMVRVEMVGIDLHCARSAACGQGADQARRPAGARGPR